jgi:uncharacterized protein YjdB
MPTFQCTESTMAPTLDVLWGSLNLLGALEIAGNPDQYDNPNGATAFGFAWAVLSAVSAGVGYDRVSKCVAAKRALAERQASASTAPAGGSGNVGLVPIQTVLIMGGRDTLAVGEQEQFIAKAFDATGTVILGRPFAWSSSNDAIASVSNAGLVTTHATGTAVIAANSNNVVGTERIVVVSAH